MKEKGKMVQRLLVSLLVVLLWGTTAVSPVAAQSETPVVRVVMFWMEGCGHCDWVKEYTLAPLQQQYGAQLELHLVELRSMADFDQLFEIAIALGVPRSNVGVPFLLIGDAVLIGSGQIPAELPGLVEMHLAAGGVDFPDAPGLDVFLPVTAPVAPQAAPIEVEAAPIMPEAAPAEVEAAPAIPAAAAAPASNGFALAVIILLGMVAALVYTAVRLLRARQGIPPAKPPVWQQAALPILTLIGLAVAAYLAYVETQAVTAICGPIGDCNAVQTSEYAYLFGIPIGVLGVIGYLAILLTWLWGQWQNDRRIPLILLGMTGFGVLFSVYLTYLEPFVIGAVCAWCLSSAVIMTLLMLIALEPAARQMQLVAVRDAKARRNWQGRDGD